jgi:hypothetical protein
MTIKSTMPICFWCKHLDTQKQYDTGATKCLAFKERIPSEIWNLEYDHREPHPDDNSVQFEKLDDYSKILAIPLAGFSDEQLERIFKKQVAWLTEGRILGIVKPPLVE